MSSERRNFYRLSIEGPLLYKIMGKENPEEKSPAYKGLLKDVSLGGVRFGTNIVDHNGLSLFDDSKKNSDKESGSKELLVQFSLPGEKESVFTYCHPRWHDQADLADPFDYYVGAKYTRGRKADILLMHSYIQRHGDKNELAKYSEKKKRRKEGVYAIDSALEKKRALATVPLRYKIISRENKRQSPFVNAVTHNLSVTGLCVRVKDMDVDNLNMAFDKTPAMPNSIALEIAIPRQINPVNALGEVRWFQKLTSRSNYNYLVGIRFLEIADRDKRVIADYIKDRPDEDASVTPRC